MKKLILLSFFIFVPVFASGGLPDGYWFEFSAKVVNTVIFFGVLFYLLKKPITAALRSQREGLIHKLEEAERKEKEASERLQAIEERMKGLKDEIEDILHKTDAAANREKERIIGQAKIEAERIRVMAEREIENQLRTATHELRKYVTDLAVTHAESIIREQMEEADIEKSMTRFLEKLEA